MTWREAYRPIIDDILRSTRGQPEREIRRALREGFDITMRRHGMNPQRVCWPYRAWLKEARAQRDGQPVKRRRRQKPCEGQGVLL